MEFDHQTRHIMQWGRFSAAGPGRQYDSFLEKDLFSSETSEAESESNTEMVKENKVNVLERSSLNPIEI